MIKKTTVTRYGSLIRLKPEFEERYIILHKHVFPGVLDRIKKCNIQNYSIFLRDGLLFSHFEYVGSDFEADMAAMADEATKEWWKLTDPMQKPLKNRKDGEWWASMKLLFQMDTSKSSFENGSRFAFTGFLKEEQSQNILEKMKAVDQSLIRKMLDANIQNLTVYQKDDQVFLYYEYVGKDFEKEMKRLQKVEEFQVLNNGLKEMMKKSSDGFKNLAWHKMTEVFHAN